MCQGALLSATRSLETPSIMAGMGIRFSCSAKTRETEPQVSTLFAAAKTPLFKIKLNRITFRLVARTVKISFMLKESLLSTNAESKSVFFTIDENVTGFSFSFSLENQSHASLVVASGDANVEYTWNSTENCYVQGIRFGFT